MNLNPVLHGGGKERILSGHALGQLIQRSIDKEWIIQVLNNPVAVVDDEYRNSTKYYGSIEGRNSLLMVAVSKSDDRTIPTVYFDTPATRRYMRGEL